MNRSLSPQREPPPPPASEVLLSDPTGNRKWLLALGGFSVFLLTASVLTFASVPGASPLLVWGVHLSPPLWLWAFVWGNALRGLATGVALTLLVEFVALSTGDPLLKGFALLLMGFGAVAYGGWRRQQKHLQVELLKADRLEVALNAENEESRHLQALEDSLRERRLRYNKLQHIANAFHLSLPLEELAPRVVEATSGIVSSADRVFLYLADPGRLELRLGASWHKEGLAHRPPEQADPFDHWVMRQAQPLLVQEPERDFRFPKSALDALSRPMGSLLAVPLVSKHRFLGVLRLESVRPGGLGANELRLVRIVGDMACLGVENSQLYGRMLELATLDDLTQLMIRAPFLKRLENQVLRARAEGVPFSLLLIDIDRFKVYNDTFGHSAGDKLLQEIGKMLTQQARPEDAVARLGGEEFLILLAGADRGEALRRAEAIRVRAQELSVSLREVATGATVSIGVSTFPQDGTSAEPLLQVADEQLYRAKRAGRNQVCHPR